MYYWNKICGFTAFFFLSVLFTVAQKNYSSTPAGSLILSSGIKDANKTQNQRLISLRPAYTLTPDYYTQHMGLICKKELALEKVTRMPLRFRLGSLQQCNYLEGKR
jgi:hypothetical protein